MNPQEQPPLINGIVRIVWRLTLIAVAMGLTFYVSAHLTPIIVNDTLSPEGVGQSGWPLPFAASFWDESVVNPHQAQQFNLVYFLLDVGIIYGILVLLELAIRRTSHFVIRQYALETSAEQIFVYGRWAFLVIICLLIAYYVFVLYLGQTPLLSDMPLNTAPTSIPD